VSGAVVKSTLKEETSTDFKLTVDATGAGAPVSVGPDMEVSSPKENINEFRGSSDFVFAFRLRKILVSKKGDIEDDDETEGTVLGAEGGHFDEAVDVFGLEAHDVSASELNIGEESFASEEGEEEVRVSAIFTR